MLKIKQEKIKYVCPVVLRDIYKKHIAALKMICSEGEATAVANIIFEHYAKLSGSSLILKGNEEADVSLAEKLDLALEKLSRHTPVQYITGEACFFGLSFLVNEHVLIPRPETEELVQEALDFLKDQPGKKIIDIGTGSGCIAVSIKKNLPSADITAADISKDALNVARVNARTNNTEILFHEIDFLEEKNYSSLTSFDVIISNPPYIPADEKETLERNVVMHEPHLALFVPQNDPLIFYKKIKSFADDHLEKNGRIFLEVHENFAQQTAAVFPPEQYDACVKKDMSGKERMLVICRCP